MIICTGRPSSPPRALTCFSQSRYASCWYRPVRALLPVVEIDAPILIGDPPAALPPDGAAAGWLWAPGAPRPVCAADPPQPAIATTPPAPAARRRKSRRETP